jgi:hypothetical protein
LFFKLVLNDGDGGFKANLTLKIILKMMDEVKRGIFILKRKDTSYVGFITKSQDWEDTAYFIGST